jgi:hypothetical protein
VQAERAKFFFAWAGVSNNIVPKSELWSPCPEVRNKKRFGRKFSKIFFKKDLAKMRITLKVKEVFFGNFCFGSYAHVKKL